MVLYRPVHFGMRRRSTMNGTVQAVTSADGTTIALEQRGEGPAVILVGGAFNDRSTVAGLAATLAPHARAFTYDRRGRGDSGDESRAGGRSSAEREFDDLAAVIRY